MPVSGPVLGTELGDEFDIGNIEGGKIRIKVNGPGLTRNGSNELEVNPPVLTYNNTLTTLEFNNGSGGLQSIDLSALTTDIFVSGGSFDASSSVLTLTDNNGVTPDVTIDLSTLLGVSTDADNLLRNGADGKGLFTKADLDGQTNILLSVFDTQIGRVVTI